MTTRLENSTPSSSTPPAADVSAAAACRFSCNGQDRQAAAGTTVAALLVELGLEPRHVAVEVNLELVPRTRHAERVLCDGDRLEIVTLVGGG